MTKPIRFPSECDRLFRSLLIALPDQGHPKKLQLWRFGNYAKELAVRYGEEHRHYHTLDHIMECLDILDGLQLPIGQMKRLMLALIYHDSIYDVDRQDNEKRSADLLASHLQDAGYEAGVADSYRELILATKHAGGILLFPSARWIVDIDLAPLGASADRFYLDVKNIRLEYSHMAGFSEEKWVRGRTAFLKSMLKRSRIYYTPEFRRKFEAQARRNLENSLKQLEKWKPQTPKRIL